MLEDTIVSLEVEWQKFHRLEQQVLHAVSQLPKTKVDELVITLGRSPRGIFLRLSLLTAEETTNINNKGVLCLLEEGGTANCLALEFETFGNEKRNIGVQIGAGD